MSWFKDLTSKLSFQWWLAAEIIYELHDQDP